MRYPLSMPLRPAFISHLSVLLGAALLALILTGCSGAEVHPAETDTFSAGNYRYYSWRSKPMVNTINSKDPVYTIDPILRARVNETLQGKGYVLDESRAQFSVDYIFAEGLRSGVVGEEATNLSTHPGVIPNRNIDQASIDNAYALGGLKETRNIRIQFNDVERNEEVWQLVISKIVDDVNVSADSRSYKALESALSQGLRPLPAAKQKMI